jgi:hypothetical protein
MVGVQLEGVFPPSELQLQLEVHPLAGKTPSRQQTGDNLREVNPSSRTGDSYATFTFHMTTRSVFVSFL